MDGFSAYSIWALGAVAAVTIREITTRKLSRDVPSLPVALATAVSICGLAQSASGVTWTPVEPVMWFISVVPGFIIGGYLFSVMAVRNGELGFVSPFRYTAMVWAIALGYLLFDEWPDLPTLTGTAIIIATGLYSRIASGFAHWKPQTGNLHPKLSVPDRAPSRLSSGVIPRPGP